MRTATHGRNRKRPCGLTILAIASVAIVIGFVEFRGRIPFLLAVATPVVPRERFEGRAFAWLSDDAYVYYSKAQHTFCRYQLSRGLCTPLMPPLKYEPLGESLQVSPNGKWLFWLENADCPIGDCWAGLPVFTCLDDGQTYNADGFDYGQWEPNSRYFLGQSLARAWVSDKNPTAAVFDTSARNAQRSTPIPSSLVLDGAISVWVKPDRLLEVVQEGPANAPVKDEPVALYDYRLDTTLHLKRTWLVAPPKGTNLEAVKLSPMGDRIAWLVDAPHAEPVRAALHRLFPLLASPVQQRQELWISRLDGTGMRVLGEVLVKSRNGEPLSAEDLRWLPDGKSLSFSYDDALWTVLTLESAS